MLVLDLVMTKFNGEACLSVYVNLNKGHHFSFYKMKDTLLIVFQSYSLKCLKQSFKTK